MVETPRSFILGTMQNTVSIPPIRPTENEELPTLNVVIAYEDFETGKQGKSTYDRLVENLGTEFQFSNQMWKFEVLTVPKLKEMAAKDAAEADIIIVAAHGATELPTAVKSWLEMALAEGIQAIGLVGLFDREAPADNPCRVYLGSIARMANLEFFSQPAVNRGMGEERINGSESATRPVSFLFDGLDSNRNISRWGINE